jgi:hypothetical protein
MDGIKSVRTQLTGLPSSMKPTDLTLQNQNVSLNSHTASYPPRDTQDTPRDLSKDCPLFQSEVETNRHFINWKWTQNNNIAKITEILIQAIL